MHMRSNREINIMAEYIIKTKFGNVTTATNSHENPNDAQSCKAIKQCKVKTGEEFKVFLEIVQFVLSSFNVKKYNMVNVALDFKQIR